MAPALFFCCWLQLLALANGDRIKDKQRSRNSFVVDVDKKIAAEDLLKELSSYHGSIIRQVQAHCSPISFLCMHTSFSAISQFLLFATQMKQMVEIYIKLAEMETKKEVFKWSFSLVLLTVVGLLLALHLILSASYPATQNILIPIVILITKSLNRIQTKK